MRFGCVLFLALGLLSVPAIVRLLHAGEADSPDATAPVTPEELAQLIEQLGDDSFMVRERATARLIEIGMEAEDAVREAATSPDAEIRLRATRILAMIDLYAFETKLNNFAADVDGSKKATLPGWEAFCERVASDAAARTLYVEMTRAESGLLSAYGAGKNAAEVVNQRAAELMQNLQRGGGRFNPISMGSTAALLFVSLDPKIQVNPQTKNNLHNFVRQAGFASGLGQEKFKAPLLKLLGWWIADSDTNNIGYMYQNVDLAMQHKIPEGRELAAKMLKQPNAPPYYKMYAILALGALGDEKEIANIEPSLEDRGNWRQFVVANNQRMTVEVRDVALAVMIELSGQEHKDYGMEGIQKDGKTFLQINSIQFVSNEAREAALEKWKKWSAEPKAKVEQVEAPDKAEGVKIEDEAKG